MKFKVLFPAPYQVTNIYDDNIDVNIVLENDEVYFGTLFTLKNIEKLMKNNHDAYFWSTDMLILEELSLQGINVALEALFKDGYFNDVFTKIGLIKTIYSHRGWKHYSDVMV
ncbi:MULTISPECIES: hypothetical protein [unclassified Sphingobacterium]|uniref:hypothetical protein n=1 Tax=unclassified Sphingobacterium TaxID=2609468 RepID=UPI0025FB9825|nr:MULTISPECIES: hypothetical protein [unclassified Sphingobacterium]